MTAAVDTNGMESNDFLSDSSSEEGAGIGFPDAVKETPRGARQAVTLDFASDGSDSDTEVTIR
jgi:hypothetical protein